MWGRGGGGSGSVGSGGQLSDSKGRLYTFIGKWLEVPWYCALVTLQKAFWGRGLMTCVPIVRGSMEAVVKVAVAYAQNPLQQEKKLRKCCLEVRNT